MRKSTKPLCGMLNHQSIDRSEIAAPDGDENCDILKLCDFGISKSTADGVPGVLNGKIQADGHLHGTPSYLAPEMIRRAEYDGKADVWAIGVITYILF